MINFYEISLSNVDHDGNLNVPKSLSDSMQYTISDEVLISSDSSTVEIQQNSRSNFFSKKGRMIWM